MSSNKNALIRYKTLDKCLKNKFKKYTLEDLMDECSEALFEFEGKESYVSKRTIQLDLQNMRSEKFGYEAPIEVYEKKYYRYSDSNYSIHNIQVNENDLRAMNDAIQILKQFKEFSMFKEMNGVIQKLEDSVHATHQKSIIHLDKNENLRGLEHIDVLYQAILNKKVLKISYQSFKAREVDDMIIHPQILKEFNNRWFLIGLKGKYLYTLALDRMEGIEVIEDITYIDQNIDADEYFKDVVGVTVTSTQRLRKVTFRIDPENAPYVKTKPIHSSQTILHEDHLGTTFQLLIQINFELERMLLGFGESIEVLGPKGLRERMKDKLQKALKHYHKQI